MLTCGVAVLGALLFLQAPAGSGNTADPTNQSPEEIKKGIADLHPSAYYILAMKLFDAGQKDEAVFWFYAGQLRYRFLLRSAPPDADPSGDPALFASLQDGVGQPINRYGWGDLKALRATLQRVLDWDLKTKNGVTSTVKHAKEWKEARAGLQKVIDYTVANEETIRQQRTKNGLENRP